MPGLESLLKRLNDHGFEFVIVGGFAGVLHGSSLVTDDLGICAVLSPDIVERLRRALAPLEPEHRMTSERLSFLEHPPVGQKVANLYLKTDAGVLDVLGNVLGVGDYQRLVKSAVEIPLFGTTCKVISLSDLITAKLAVGREKDLFVVKELRAIAAKRSGLPGK